MQMITVYVLTNPAAPGYIKIGCTDNLDRRLRELDNTSAIMPFRVFYAALVDAGRGPRWVEQRLHETFAPERVRSRREYFTTSPERARAALSVAAVEVLVDNYEPVSAAPVEAAVAPVAPVSVSRYIAPPARMLQDDIDYYEQHGHHRPIGPWKDDGSFGWGWPNDDYPYWEEVQEDPLLLEIAAVFKEGGKAALDQWNRDISTGKRSLAG